MFIFVFVVVLLLVVIVFRLVIVVLISRRRHRRHCIVQRSSRRQRRQHDDDENDKLIVFFTGCESVVRLVFVLLFDLSNVQLAVFVLLIVVHLIDGCSSYPFLFVLSNYVHLKFFYNGQNGSEKPLKRAHPVGSNFSGLHLETSQFYSSTTESLPVMTGLMAHVPEVCML